jgi:hypothetical protein
VPVDMIPAAVTAQPFQPLTPGILTTIQVSKDAALNVVGLPTKWTISFTSVTKIPANGMA